MEKCNGKCIGKMYWKLYWKMYWKNSNGKCKYIII